MSRPPPPSTPPRFSPFPALSNKRRKTNADPGAYVDPAALLAFLDSQSLDENSSSEEFFKSFQCIHTMAKEAIQLTRAVIKKVGSPHTPSHRIQLTPVISAEDSDIHVRDE